MLALELFDHPATDGESLSTLRERTVPNASTPGHTNGPERAPQAGQFSSVVVLGCRLPPIQNTLEETAQRDSFQNQGRRSLSEGFAPIDN
jgi:hypothetical protein